MTDRLEKIIAKAEREGIKPWTEDVFWLVAEIERLQAELANAPRWDALADNDERWREIIRAKDREIKRLSGPCIHLRNNDQAQEDLIERDNYRNALIRAVDFINATSAAISALTRTSSIQYTVEDFLEAHDD